MGCEANHPRSRNCTFQGQKRAEVKEMNRNGLHGNGHSRASTGGQSRALVGRFSARRSCVVLSLSSPTLSSGFTLHGEQIER